MRQSEISTALRSLLAMTQLYKGRFTMALPRDTLDYATKYTLLRSV